MSELRQVIEDATKRKMLLAWFLKVVYMDVPNSFVIMHWFL